MSAEQHGWPPDVAKQVKRMCRRSDGRRKRRLYRGEAERVADRTGCSAYVCPVCGWWHVGSVKAG